MWSAGQVYSLHLVKFPLVVWEGDKVSIPWSCWQFGPYFSLSQMHTHKHSRGFQKHEEWKKKKKWLFTQRQGSPLLCPARLERTVNLCVFRPARPSSSCCTTVTQHYTVLFFFAHRHDNGCCVAANSERRMCGLQPSICHFCCHNNARNEVVSPPVQLGRFFIRGCSCIISGEISLSCCSFVNIRSKSKGRGKVKLK